MRKGVAMCCATLAALLSTEASALNGNEFRALADYPRMTYVVGVMDTWVDVSNTIGGIGPDDVVATAVATMYGNLPKCASDRKMTNAQVLAIVDKYLRDNPTKWDQWAPVLVWEAIFEACFSP